MSKKKRNSQPSGRDKAKNTVIPLPKDTKGIASNFFVSQGNTGLLYDKYFRYGIKPNKDDLQELVKTVSNPPKEHKIVLQRRKEFLEEEEGYYNFIAQTESRMICGIGGPSAIDVGFFFHPLYGFPIIPGSSIKGLCNHYFRESFQKQLKCYPIWHRLLFGHESSNKEDDELAGGIIFHDAWLAAKQKKWIYTDVMTSHYHDYYEKGWAPSGNSQTNPISFLSVRTGTRFEFWIKSNLRSPYLEKCQPHFDAMLADLQNFYVRNNMLTKAQTLYTLDIDILEKCLEDMIRVILKKALACWGIGAKTGSGYGYMGAVGENS